MSNTGGQNVQIALFGQLLSLGTLSVCTDLTAIMEDWRVDSSKQRVDENPQP